MGVFYGLENKILYSDPLLCPILLGYFLNFLLVLLFFGAYMFLSLSISDFGKVNEIK